MSEEESDQSDSSIDHEDGFQLPTFFESVFEMQWRAHSEKSIRIKRRKAIELILKLATDLNIADEGLMQRAKKATRQIEDWRTISAICAKNCI